MKELKNGGCVSFFVDMPSFCYSSVNNLHLLCLQKGGKVWREGEE